MSGTGAASISRVSRARAVPALLATLIAGPLFAQVDGYLFAIPLEIRAAGRAQLPEELDIALHVAEPDRAAMLIEAGGALALVGRDAGQITVRAASRPVLGGVPTSGHRAPSFVIDYDEPAVGSAVDRLRDAAGADPAPGAIGSFVHDFITEKSYAGNFDLASRVATTRRGDCTEHAVLTAALARAAGLPARVVLGVVIVEGAGGSAAYGHAWTEIHAGPGWHLVDSTRPGAAADVSHVRYLPLMALEDEGPGYAIDLLRLTAAHPAGITVAPPDRR